MGCRSCARIVFITVPFLLWDGIRLVLYVLLLLPGFVRFGWYYWVVSHRRSIRYGTASCRQTLDLYYPSTSAVLSFGTSHAVLVPKPVVLFVPGGAWLIGYKMWGSLLARVLTACGILVIMPDYRNYPWGTVPDQVNDIAAVLTWTREHVEEFGGDPQQLVVTGQSAGGHLLGTYLIRTARQMTRRPTDPNVVSSSVVDDPERSNRENLAMIKGFLSLSAPFHLSVMTRTFQKHGFDDHLIDRIFGGQVASYDPFHLVQEEINTTGSVAEDVSSLLGDALPPIRIYHGTRDKTVPCHGANLFHEVLVQAGVNATFQTYEGWTHTDAILEGPMNADHRFHRDIFDAVREWTHAENIQWPPVHSPVLRRLCCPCTIEIARKVTPF